MRASITGKGFVIPLTGVEAVKWFGLVCMLIEHVYRYVFDAYPLVVYAIGRMAFPLFAMALAVSVPREDAAFWRVIKRLVVFGGIAEVLRVPVMPAGSDLNVMFTFALALIVARFVGTNVTGLIVAIIALSLSGFVEYGLAGVVFVVLLRVYFSSLNGWVVLGAIAALCVANLSWVPALAFLLAPVVASQQWPRVRGFFYWAYCGQWPVLWGLRHVV